MRPYREREQAPVEADENDREMMGIVDNAFASSPRIRGGMKSLIADIEPIVKDMVDKDTAFTSLDKLFHHYGSDPNALIQRRRYGNMNANDPNPMQKMLIGLVITSIKNKHTKLGEESPVYEEEVKWMSSRESEEVLPKLERCMKGD